MNDLFKKAIAFTLYWECNYPYRKDGMLENIDDGAGYTKWGLCEKYDSKFCPPGKTIKDLTYEDAVAIYEKKYFLPWMATVPHFELMARMLDINVNRGFGGLSIILQNTINKFLETPVAVDGCIGPRTLTALKSVLDTVDNNKVYDEFLFQISEYYKSQVIASMLKKDISIDGDVDEFFENLRDKNSEERKQANTYKTSGRFFDGWMNRTEDNINDRISAIADFLTKTSS